MTRKLKELGCEVWVATTRPYLRLDNVDPDTREWLRRNDIQYDYMIYGDDKYEQLSQLTQAGRVVGVLEDLPEQYETAERLGLHPILAVGHHNMRFVYERAVARNPTNSADSLISAGVRLADRVLAWHAQHHPNSQNQEA